MTLEKPWKEIQSLSFFIHKTLLELLSKAAFSLTCGENNNNNNNNETCPEIMNQSDRMLFKMKSK